MESTSMRPSLPSPASFSKIGYSAPSTSILTTTKSASVKEAASHDATSTIRTRRMSLAASPRARKFLSSSRSNDSPRSEDVSRASLAPPQPSIRSLQTRIAEPRAQQVPRARDRSEGSITGISTRRVRGFLQITYRIVVGYLQIGSKPSAFAVGILRDV